MKKILAFILLVTVFGCSQAPVKKQVKKETKKEESTKVVQTKSPVDGTYVFDTEKYKKVQLEKNKLFKKMKSKDQDLMMRVFRPFQITLEGNKATASFAHDVVKGHLRPLSQTSGVTRLHMTPTDQSKQDQAVTLIIEENDLILDPGKKETDKMYFKRVN